MSAKGFPRGSEWRKWDLHIHNPASFHWKGDKFAGASEDKKKEILDDLVTKINSVDVAAFAIMDYWTFDGYLEIRHYQAQPLSKKLTKGSI